MSTKGYEAEINLFPPFLRVSPPSRVASFDDFLSTSTLNKSRCPVYSSRLLTLRYHKTFLRISLTMIISTWCDYSEQRGHPTPSVCAGIQTPNIEVDPGLAKGLPSYHRKITAGSSSEIESKCERIVSQPRRHGELEKLPSTNISDRHH